MEELRKIHYEINYMTEDTKMSRGIIDALKSEFDLIQLWRSMMRPFGYDASEILDRFMALSLRKLLCDENPY